MDFENPKKKIRYPKVWPNFCDFQKENQNILGYGFKNL
jgi:hypothetical protein